MDDSIKKQGNKLHARDEKRKLAVLIAIEKIERPVTQDLVDATGIPERSIHLLIRSLGNVGVIIERVNGRRHGYYQISDCGIFNMDRLPEVIKQSYPLLPDQIESYAQKKSAALDALAIEKREKQKRDASKQKMEQFMRFPHIDDNKQESTTPFC